VEHHRGRVGHVRGRDLVCGITYRMQIKVDGIVREFEFSRSRLGWYWYFALAPGRVRTSEHSLPIRLEDHKTFSVRTGGHHYESIET
jgi:hypothetical protein